MRQKSEGHTPLSVQWKRMRTYGYLCRRACSSITEVFLKPSALLLSRSWRSGRKIVCPRLHLIKIGSSIPFSRRRAYLGGKYSVKKHVYHPESVNKMCLRLPVDNISKTSVWWYSMSHVYRGYPIIPRVDSGNPGGGMKENRLLRGVFRGRRWRQTLPEGVRFV